MRLDYLQFLIGRKIEKKGSENETRLSTISKR